MRTLSDTRTRMVSMLEALLKEALFLFKDHPDWQGSTGGYFCLATAITGEPIYEPVMIGEVSDQGKAEKYKSFCQEKAKRLASNPMHDSSWQSRVPQRDMWGGAVVFGEYIYSLSGLPELGDEALMLILAEIENCSNEDVIRKAGEIAARSGNQYWKHLRGFVGRF